MVNTVAGEAQRRGLTNVVTTCGSAEDLPFPPETFDLVMSRYSAHHWHDVDGGIAQMSRVLRPGGLALFSDVISPEVALFDTWLQTFELLRDPSHVRDLQQSEWVDLLDAKGFVITRMERLRLRLDFASWTARMRTPEARWIAIRMLQGVASKAVRDYFEIQDDGTFTVDTLVIAATRRT